MVDNKGKKWICYSSAVIGYTGAGIAKPFLVSDVTPDAVLSCEVHGLTRRRPSELGRSEVSENVANSPMALVARQAHLHVRYSTPYLFVLVTP